MPKYFREVNKHFSGDKEKAASYMGVARSLLGGLVEMSGDLFQNARKVVLKDGTRITVSFAGAIANVLIEARSAVSEALTGAARAIFVRPSWNNNYDWELDEDTCPHNMKTTYIHNYSPRDWISRDNHIVCIIDSLDYDRYFSMASQSSISIDGSIVGVFSNVAGAALYEGRLIIITCVETITHVQYSVLCDGTVIYQTGQLTTPTTKWTNAGVVIQKSVVFNDYGDRASTAISSHEVLTFSITTINGSVTCSHSIAHVSAAHNPTVGEHYENVTNGGGGYDLIYTNNEAYYLMACDYHEQELRYFFVIRGLRGETHTLQETFTDDEYPYIYEYISSSSQWAGYEITTFAIVSGSAIISRYTAINRGSIYDFTNHVDGSDTSIQESSSYGATISNVGIGSGQIPGIELLGLDVRASSILLRYTSYRNVIIDGWSIYYRDPYVLISSGGLPQRLYEYSRIYLILQGASYEVSNKHYIYGDVMDLSLSSELPKTIIGSALYNTTGTTVTPQIDYHSVIKPGASYSNNHVFHTDASGLCFTHVDNTDIFPSDYEVNAYSLCGGGAHDITNKFVERDLSGIKIHPINGEAITRHFGIGIALTQ